MRARYIGAVLLLLTLAPGCARAIAIDSAQRAFRAYRDATVPHQNYSDADAAFVDCGGEIDRPCQLDGEDGRDCLGHRADELIQRLGED